MLKGVNLNVKDGDFISIRGSLVLEKQHCSR